MPDHSISSQKEENQMNYVYEMPAEMLKECDKKGTVERFEYDTNTYDEGNNKPLKKGAFQFAVNNNVPVVPCFITMEDSDIIGPDGFKIQEYTIHIMKPIYPDPLKSKQENIENMMEKNYMMWKRQYEASYGRKLEYINAR